jgi:hypothetical protein
MSAPVGSLRDLQDLLDGVATLYGEPRYFPFYSVLLYTPMNGLNESLHRYIVGRWDADAKSLIGSHFELFSAQTGPNWLVAIVEDINRGQEIERFSAGAVYEIARDLGARVDDLPIIVFFTEPRTRKETLVLKLVEALPAAERIKDEDIINLISKIAATVDGVWHRHGSSDGRLNALRDELANALWPLGSTAASKAQSGLDWLKVSSANAPTIIAAITSVVNLIKALGLY